MSLFPLGLISQGGGGGASSSYELISTTLGGGTSISFSSIPSTYKHLQLRFVSAATTNGWRVQIQANGVSSNYTSHVFYGDGSTIYTDSRTARASYDINVASNSLNTGHSAGVVDILDYTNTTTDKTFRTIYGNPWIDGTQRIMFGSGLFLSTSAITSLTVLPNGGTFASTSRFSLYGSKG